MKRLPVLAALAVGSLALAACSPADDSSSDQTPTASASIACTPESLATTTPGTLTIATGDPAYEPWVVGDAPESGEGFEAAVAYAAAQQLGFEPNDIIVSLNGSAADTTKTLESLLQQDDGFWQVEVDRAGQRIRQIFR